MSQVLERLLPFLVRHLSGDMSHREGRQKGSNSVTTVSALHEADSRRWRRCIELWRRLLGSDRLFLALLFHSGSLWAEEWQSSLEPPSETDHEEDPRHSPRRSWSEAVMWFLQLHHDGGGKSTNAKNANNNPNSMNHSANIRRGGLHIHSHDEAATQRTATGLLTEWFATIDSCGPYFVCAYYFSCAIKVAALVGNAAIIEDTPHLHELIAREPRSAPQFTAFQSILCCLLVEEAQQHPLRLPPPFFLLNFNAIGRGSRVGVWLPRGTSGEGEFHSCEVTSAGVMLRTPTAATTGGAASPSSLSSSSSLGAGAGDLLMGVRLLDERYARPAAVDAALPRLYESEEKRVRRVRGGGMGGAALPDIPRRWSALEAATNGTLRADLLHPRAVSVIVSSPNNNSNNNNNNNHSSNGGASAGGNGAGGGVGGRRRAGNASHAETSIGTLVMAPLRRNSRLTATRDALATIALCLANTARRLIGCRGLFVASDLSATAKSALSTRAKSVSGPHSHSAPHAPPGGLGGRGVASFQTPVAELEALVECALHLFLSAILLYHALPSEVATQLDAWVVEVTSNAADVALSTPQPVVRLLRAVGYTLCLAPQPSQSLLVAVGLFATLARRQRESGGTTGWWEVFRACVLRDAGMPGQLHGAIWDLVERVEKGLRGGMQIRVQKKRRVGIDNTSEPNSPQLSNSTNNEEAEEMLGLGGRRRRLRLQREEHTRGPSSPSRERRMATHEREAEQPAKKNKPEEVPRGPLLPAGIRMAQEVSVVVSMEPSQLPSLGEKAMLLWWSLEQQAERDCGVI